MRYCFLFMLLLTANLVFSQTGNNLVVYFNQPTGTLAHNWNGCGVFSPSYYNEHIESQLISELPQLGFHYFRIIVPFSDLGSYCIYKKDTKNNPVFQPDGELVYDWSYLDKLIQDIINAGMTPLISLGYVPAPYQIQDTVCSSTSDISNPPKDFNLFRLLVINFLQHEYTKYGNGLNNWYFEFWNEPFEQGAGLLVTTTKDSTVHVLPSYLNNYINRKYWYKNPLWLALYDFTASAIDSVEKSTGLTGLKFGVNLENAGRQNSSPHCGSISPNVDSTQTFPFLRHILSGMNYYDTTKTGVRCSFISIHGYLSFTNSTQPPGSMGSVAVGSITNRLDRIYRVLDSLKISNSLDLQVINDEWNVTSEPGNYFLRSSLFPASVLIREMAALQKYPDVWHWQHSCFEGFSDSDALVYGHNLDAFEFVTNTVSPYGFHGIINKPVLNAYKLLNKLGSVRDSVFINQNQNSGSQFWAMASTTDTSYQLILTNFLNLSDGDTSENYSPSANINISFNGLPKNLNTYYIYTIDSAHSNTYNNWRLAGKPEDFKNSLGSLDSLMLNQIQSGDELYVEKKTVSNFDSLSLTLQNNAVVLIEIPKTITGIQNNKQLVLNYNLDQNYPNPFNPSTIIHYEIPNGGVVTLKIYDELGREVKTLVNQYQSKGRYDIDFNASSLASGIYFYQLRADSYLSTKKMLLLK